MMRGAGSRLRACAALVCLALAVAGCGATPEKYARASSGQSGSSSASGAAAPAGGSAATATDSSYAVGAPGKLHRSLLTRDLLITSPKTIPASVRDQVAATPGIHESLPISFAALSLNGRTLSIAGANPADFRRFTPYQSAYAQEVWTRVAGGEIAVDPSLPRRLEDKKGYLKLGAADDAPQVHIGAYAPLVKQISAVVNLKRAAQIGMPVDNALLISTGELTPSKVTGRLKKLLGPGIAMQTLATEFTNTLQTAVLSGTSVSSAVGTFSYTPNPDGTLTPESSWVSAYIRRETMPIIGTVTGNKGMLPQLRAALDEVVQRGLTSKIHANEYGGCYVPRFIAKDPSKGLSLHSWGMAVDLNVPGNQRGTVGQMDRQVVLIFKKWGFAWGGDWSYTDPMHFEMDKVVKVG